MKDFRYTSINRILDKLRRDLDMDDLYESDVIEWIGEALEAIGAITQYEDVLAFIEVKNFTCCIPNGTYQLHQVARNNCFSGAATDPLCPALVQSTITTVVAEEEAIVPVALDCNGTPVNAYELAYYRPYFDLQAEYGVFKNSTFHNKCFTPIKLAANNFFASVSSSVDNAKDLYSTCQDEYQIISKGQAFRFSFETGSIALAYTKPVLDDDGYPMIPDHYSYTTAITKYITYKVMEQRFYRNERGSDSRYAKAEQDWHWYCKQAGNLAIMPRGEDDHQDLLEQRSQMLPKLNRYYGFFGKMNKAEGRKFNDPDGRNNYFSGI
tara:strand:+ start:2047 stop:3015 length:969 start_codon:yes stop_codon:yes gene_type:complete